MKTATSVNKIDFQQVLKSHQLKQTPLRIALLKIFTQLNKPLSQSEIQLILKKQKNSFDRVSIYRNLLQLKKSGLLHQIQPSQFVFCSHECHHHAHLILFCQKCHNHQEIDNHQQIDSLLKVLGNFNFLSKSGPLFIKGVCSKCS